MMGVIDLMTVAVLDAKIEQIPYRGGSRFTPQKRCLPGTRLAFLDFIESQNTGSELDIEEAADFEHSMNNPHS